MPLAAAVSTVGTSGAVQEAAFLSFTSTPRAVGMVMLLLKLYLSSTASRAMGSLVE